MRSFLRRRLSGDAPITTVFWRDMLLTGSGVTLASLAAALVLIANAAPTALVVAVFVLSIPYAIFITVAVWRCSRQLAGPRREIYRTAAMIWLIASLIL